MELEKLLDKSFLELPSGNVPIKIRYTNNIANFLIFIISASIYEDENCHSKIRFRHSRSKISTVHDMLDCPSDRSLGIFMSPVLRFCLQFVHCSHSLWMYWWSNFCILYVSLASFKGKNWDWNGSELSMTWISNLKPGETICEPLHKFINKQLRHFYQLAHKWSGNFLRESHLQDGNNRRCGINIEISR